VPRKIDNHIYKDELFNEDVQSYKFKELRDWIYRCRTRFDISNFNDETEYYKAKKEFADMWYEHYKNNKSFYESERYKKALISLALNRPRVKTVINKKTVVLDNIFSFMDENPHNPFAQVLASVEDDDLEKNSKEYYAKLELCFKQKAKEKDETDKDVLVNALPEELNVRSKKKSKDNSKRDEDKTFKELLDEIVKEVLVYDTVFTLKIKKNKRIQAYSTIDELMADIENTENYVEDEAFVNLDNGKYQVSVGYQDLLLAYSIRKNIFNEYISPNFCEKAFNKKFFINLGFMLCLPFPMLKTFLEVNGFSIDKSDRIFDKIIDRAFKIGFDRDTAIALINDANEILEKIYKRRTNKKGKEKRNYYRVPSLTADKDDED